MISTIRKDSQLNLGSLKMLNSISSDIFFFSISKHYSFVIVFSFLHVIIGNGLLSLLATPAIPPKTAPSIVPTGPASIEPMAAPEAAAAGVLEV